MCAGRKKGVKGKKEWGLAGGCERGGELPGGGMMSRREEGEV